MVAQLYHKYTLPANLLDARLDGEFSNLYSYITSSLSIPLPIASGGTNSSTALSNNRVMKSSGGAIVEAAAITASRALISDSNGIPTPSTVTSTTLAFLDATSSVQTQINGKQASGSYITSLTGGVTASGPGASAATVVTNANLTGPITSSGNATAIASQTGTGTKFVVDTSPVLVTPNIGTPSAGTLTNCTGLPAAGILAAAWSTSTPTISAQTGTITTSSASFRYQQVGKTVIFSTAIVITTAGTGIGNLIATLPVNTNDTLGVQVAVGYDGLTGVMVRAFAVTNTLVIRNYINGSIIASGTTVYVTGLYEAA